MAAYDFHQLSSHDFEIFARDLLQAHWRIELQSFKAGKDGGVDLLHRNKSQKIIVQCKHYVRTGLSGLMNALSKEVDKIRLQRPTRYVVVTSVPLSDANKAAIVDIFGASVISADDVLGQEDLNNYLAQHPEVEQQHYKLWLASRTVLDRVLHSAVVTRTDFAVQKVNAAICKYVQTETFPNAMELLHAQRVAIITGPPGVGKTTLANMLLYSHLAEGYEAVVIQNELDDGASLFQAGKRQIFYYDDFLGATYLGEQGLLLSRNGDRALLDFIGMVRASSTARFVLTTREHIMSQAMTKSERLRHSDIGDHKLLLSITDYTFEQKAKILYNHLYFSDLPIAYQLELLQGNFYLEIIRHAKFNPRLIEWLSSFQRIRNVSVEQYRDFVRGLLADPSEIWIHAYERELTDAGRSLLLAIGSLDGRAHVDALESAFRSLHAERARRYAFSRNPGDFRVALRELDGAFIKSQGNGRYAVLDPSVLDLFNALVWDSPDNAIDLISCAVSVEQIGRLWALAQNEKQDGLKKVLTAHTTTLVTAMERTILLAYRRRGADNHVTYHGISYELRLGYLVSIADQLRSPELLALIPPLLDRLEDDHTEFHMNVSECTTLLQAVNVASWPALTELTALRTRIRDRALDINPQISSLQEWRELIEAVELNGVDADIRETLLAVFSDYRRRQFGNDVFNANSVEFLNGMLEDLDALEQELGLEFLREREEVWFALEDFENQREAVADEQMDQWRESYEEKLMGEESVKEMFQTLTLDHQHS